jgi:hypothetical protein
MKKTLRHENVGANESKAFTCFQNERRMEMCGQLHILTAFPQKKKDLSTRAIKGLLQLRAGLGPVDKRKFLPLLRIKFQLCSSFLYRHSYPDLYAILT